MIKKSVEIMARSKYTVAFSGAGMSAESGINTFRDVGGIWDRFDPFEIGTFEGITATLKKNPGKILAFLKELADSFESAEPNPGHYALAELEEMGLLKSIITQNVDNLHRAAGNTITHELHGTLYRAKCMKCGDKVRTDRICILQMLHCDCGGLMRPDVVMFGEMVQGLKESFAEAKRCDLMLVLGTSGVVSPACDIPFMAHHFGKIIEINPNENAFSEITSVYIDGKVGDVLPTIVEEVRKYGNER